MNKSHVIAMGSLFGGLGLPSSIYTLQFHGDMLSESLVQHVARQDRTSLGSACPGEASIWTHKT